MAHQFAHAEVYPRRSSPLAGSGPRSAREAPRSTRQVFAEAGREPGHCDHVGDAARPPVVLHGLAPAEAEAAHDRLAAAARTRAGRRVRADAPTLYTEVHSHPAPPAELHRPDVQAWLRRVTASRVEAVGARGGRVLGVWLHADEARVHVHLAAVNAGDPQLRAALLHDGRRAQDEARARGEGRKGRRLAYCAAMRAWQDEVHRGVSMAFGLARVGPRRRRLSRAGWHAEQRALLAAAEARRGAEEALARVGEQREAARATATRAMQVLDQAAEMRRRAEDVARRDAERQARVGAELAGREARVAAREAQLAEAGKRLARASRVPGAALDGVLELLRRDLMRHPEPSVRDAALTLQDGIAAALTASDAEGAAAAVRAAWEEPGAEGAVSGPR